MQFNTHVDLYSSTILWIYKKNHVKQGRRGKINFHEIPLNDTRTLVIKLLAFKLPKIKTLVL